MRIHSLITGPALALALLITARAATDPLIRLRSEDNSTPSASTPSHVSHDDSLPLPKHSSSPTESAASSVVPPVTGTGTADDAAKMSDEEIKRRQVIISRANKAIYDADRLRSAGELESAAKRYQYVVDVTAPTGKTAFIHGKAKTNLADTRAELGKVAMDNKDYKAAYENYEVASKLFPDNAAYSERLAKAREKWQKEGGSVPSSTVQSGSSASGSTTSSNRVRRVRRSGAREKMESSTYRTRGEGASSTTTAPVPQAGSRARVSDPAAGF